MHGQVRELFRAAIENAPCIVFMDEVDAITPKRETSSRGMEKRIVAQVCLLLFRSLNTLFRPFLFPNICFILVGSGEQVRNGFGWDPESLKSWKSSALRVGNVLVRCRSTFPPAKQDRLVNISAFVINIRCVQLLTCMDSLTIENTGGKPVVVIGATNRPNDLDSALRRAGRFDREICLGVPDLAARARILQVK